MITKIVLKNWRTHLDNEIDFSEGTNCFIGHMGSGKTSIIDALCFGLFGTFLQIQQRKLKLEDIVMKKPEAKDKAQVTVFFDIGDDNEWSVKRTIESGRSTAELRKNGDLVEGPQPTKVNAEIESILKMNYDLFSRAVYSEQNQLDMFLTIPKGQRMKKIDELLAIDKFEKARANTKSLVNRCLMVINEKEKFIQNLENDDNLKKLGSIKNELAQLKEKDGKIGQQMDVIIRKKSDITKDITNLKEQQKKLQNIEEDNKKFTALIELLEADLEKIKTDLVEYAEKTDEELEDDIRKEGEEIIILNNSLSEEKNNFDELIKNFAEDNANINLLEKEKIPALEKMVEELGEINESIKRNPIKKLKKTLEKSREYLETNQLSLQKSIAQISELESSLVELDSVEGSCPICDSKLTKEKKAKLVAKKKKTIKTLKAQIEKQEKMIGEIKAELPGLENKIKAVEKLEYKFEQIKDSEKELKDLQKQLEKLKEKIGVFENQKRMFEKNINLIEEKLNSVKERQTQMKQVLSKKTEANEKIEKIEDYKRRLVVLESEKSELASFSPVILEKVEADYREVISLESEMQANARNLKQLIDDKNILLTEIEKKKKMLEDYVAETGKIADISEQLKILETALQVTQEQLRKDFVEAVNEAMQSIWPELYPYRDIYNIRLGIEGGDYILQLQDSTGWLSADGIVSGGERSLACLALRIAFSLVLAPQLRMLVLDEPTANLDTQAVEMLADVLRERITRLVEQCFLVTHDDKLKEAVSGFCYEFNRDKSKDGVTEVTLVSSPLQI